MTKVTKVVDFHSYIFADLTRQVISPSMSMCCNERNLTQAHSCSHMLKLWGRHSVQTCFTAVRINKPY